MADPTQAEAVPDPQYGPCPTRLDNQPTPSARPWRYGHAASIEGAHWNIYAGEGIDGWLVGMVTTEADAALIAEAVNAEARPPAPGSLDARFWHRVLSEDSLLPECGGTHAMGYATCQRLAAALTPANPSEPPGQFTLSLSEWEHVQREGGGSPPPTTRSGPLPQT